MNRIITVLLFALCMPLVQAADLDKGTKAFENGDYNSARYELEPLAEAGDAQAQVLIGVMYATGNGYQQDYVQAHKWMTLSARAGNVDAKQARQNIASRMSRAQLQDARSQADRFRPTPLARDNSSNLWAQAPQSMPSGRALVAEIQSSLNALGYDAGSADGLMGRRTAAAISDFQRQVGVRADGKASQDVLLAIRQAEAEGLRAAAPTPNTPAVAVPAAGDWYFTEPSLEGIMGSLRSLLANYDNRALRSGVTDLVQRSDWPWTDRVFHDDFKSRAGQGGLDWQVTRGEYSIRDGLLSDARSTPEPAPAEPSERKRIGKEEVLGILGALLGAQLEQDRSAPTRAPARALTTPNEVRLAAASRPRFLLRARVLAQDPAQDTSFVLQRTVRGVADELRLRYDANAQQLLIEHASDRGVRQIATAPLRLEAGRNYKLEWARMHKELMQVALNGEVIISDARLSLRGGFDTFAWRNYGGSYLLSEVEMHTRQRR